MKSRRKSARASARKRCAVLASWRASVRSAKACCRVRQAAANIASRSSQTRRPQGRRFCLYARHLATTVTFDTVRCNQRGEHQMLRSMLVLTVAAVALGACATKRYPVATPLSSSEASLMTCRELAIEEERIETTRTQIADTAQTDWRSIAGFLGDYGIGNAMARSEADAALQRRSETIRTAQTSRRCSGPNEPDSTPAPTAAEAPVQPPAPAQAPEPAQ